MIVGKLQDLTQQHFLAANEKLKIAFDFLKNTDLTSCPLGRITIDGDRIYANNSKYETKDIDGALWEAHKNYLDIQFIAEGSEWIGVCDTKEVTVTKEYDPASDILFGTAPENTGVKMTPGMYMILFPEEAHMPCIKLGDSAPVHKIVVKVAIEA